MDFMEKNFGKLTFARALKANRLASGLLQEQLANKVKVSKMAISSYETGKELPSAATAKKIAKALKMDFRMYEVLIVQDLIAKKGFTGVTISLKAG
ncbi:MAG: helix-turn-helix transcriptional regulator [Oligoflexus sp.]|nr:helix-turn-helix transcriptional regulator [Oligoflexus sp.]